MPDDIQTNTFTDNTQPANNTGLGSAALPQADPVVQPAVPSIDASDSGASDFTAPLGIMNDVATKIAESHNILVALSSDPSVDEMAAAIGLSLYLDRLGKRATAIYSGSTPNALEFLKPEETFESTADALQDFVIALNKEKADHLRYKLDGEFVKIFITPYRTRISEEDLEFSYGDFNVDLVLALDVANGIDLDAALREHGRIMHDAVVVNITTGNPGKLGEIEWSDKSSSSVSEMVAKLLYATGASVPIEKEEATAFLTGIVAATNRFSSASTTPVTMQLASRLMESGANQQLISQNITPDIDNNLLGLSSSVSEKRDTDPTKLDIEHGNEQGVDETKVIDDVITEKESTLLDDLKAAEASLAMAGAEAVPETKAEPVKIDSANSTIEEPSLPEVPEISDAPSSIPEPIAPETPKTPEIPEIPEAPEALTPPEPFATAPTEPTIAEPISSEPAPTEPSISASPEMVIAPSESFAANTANDDVNRYGKMLEEALAEENGPAPENPAVFSAPEVTAEPEINGVPEINYTLPADAEVLPPPPAPPIDLNKPLPDVPAFPDIPPAPEPTTPPAPEPTTPLAPEPTAPASPEPTPLGPQPAMQDQVYSPAVNDPSAFKIPGL